jgi:1-acyl-sn-glycerol-3-phosphate acyltransferase
MENYHGSGLIIANHRSYFDPIVIVSHVAFPVGKKEVASWPLIGYLCKISVVFVDRKCQDKANNENIKEIINSGNSVINFPAQLILYQPPLI